MHRVGFLPEQRSQSKLVQEMHRRLGRILSPIHFATLILADGAYVEGAGIDVASGITIGLDKILRQISYERGLYARTTF